MVDGSGNPNTSPSFAEALELLYGIAYTLKFKFKEDGNDFVVPPLEALWWAKNPKDFITGNKDAWMWTAMIMMPDELTTRVFNEAKAKLALKKHLNFDRIRLAALEEGDSYQIIHFGPYDEEAPTLAKLHDELMPQNGYTFNGHHHEIYLSDARRTAPGKLRTILRQPVRSIS